MGAPSMQTATNLAYQGVVVLNLLHCRLSCQWELDDLEMVQLLWGRSTARRKQNSHPSAHTVHKHRGHAEMPVNFLQCRQAKYFTENIPLLPRESHGGVTCLAAADILKDSGSQSLACTRTAITLLRILLTPCNCFWKLLG